ncbi:C40 family peptidase [Ruminiclostridium papyrosolvens]|uniref:Glycoside hydrolase n=1 Tax=Ruminiclostridium papyrosolvens C7 TaxID=1330534 RepID=U4R689_9FIRM|nr:C40 family peptidase [Ruminiclostridium papyrosolvens]EPR13556.1 glycoside hydrolase [Ruminiclostridium papyrosolvens C7]
MKQKITKALAGCIIALIFAFASTAVMAATMPAKVTGTNVKMRKAQTTSSSIVTKLTNAKVTVTDFSKGWYKVSYNKKTGWVNGNYVKLQPVNGVINANGVNFRKSAGTSGKVISSLKKSTSVQILGVVKGWNKVKIGSKVGYVSSKFVNISSASTKTSRSASVVAFAAIEDDGSVNSKLIAYAREFEGVRYVYGGTNPQTGFDCSGFVGYVYKKFDVNLNRSAQGMYSNGVKVSKAQLKAGDILFFDASSRKASGQIDHAGIYIGGDTFIHASSSNGKVRVQKLSEYRGTYIGAKRVI